MTLRVVVVVTHLLGAGHLTRAAALARAFARAGHDTTLVSGGMPAPLVRTDGVQFVQLPPVRTIGTDFRILLDENGQTVVPVRLEARRNMLIELLDDLRPDVVLTELFPFGRRALAGEFTILLEQARQTRPDTLIVASVRDILVAPSKAVRVAETHEALKRFYDAVLVHGDPSLVPLEASWPLDESTRALLRYTGYVDDGAPAETASHNGRDEIIVSGGSSSASLPLYRAAIAAASIIPDRRWRVLVGLAVTEAEFASLCGAVPPNMTLERARPDFRCLLANAAVSVSQAGYNTIVDVLRAGCRAVLVPFEQGYETEQRLRAERLAARGRAEILAEADLSSTSLSEAVHRIVRRQRPDRETVSLDGAEQSVAIVEKLADRGSAYPRGSRTRHVSAWNRLDDALSRAAERGTVISFWWRDDDAVAHTPLLDRLLGLARAHKIAIAIAAIPACVEASLVERLAIEPLARVLVHGLVHANHAPEGQKKAEFGSDRPLPQLADDALEALRLAQAKFGNALLPVFVPPWNRVAPGLASQLSKLGFSGLSTFGPLPTEKGPHGIVQMNAHIDPIDWHHGRSLRATETLVAELAGTIEARRADEGREWPIGLLTHHLLHDDELWSFCEELLARLVRHATVHFEDPSAMFVGAQTMPT